MGFSMCHPAVNLIYFACMLGCTLTIRHPVFLGISLAAAFVYSIRLSGRRALCRNLCLLPLAAAFALWYGAYHHFGVTVLGINAVGNALTLESHLYGLTLGLSAAGTIMWLSCIHAVFTADKVVYLFGRVSPRLALFLAVLLRLVPRIRAQWRLLVQSRWGIGRTMRQGSPLRRLQNGLRCCSALIGWSIEAIAGACDAMICRGVKLRGRTAFSIYRFDNRDRALVVGIFFCITLTAMGLLLHQGNVAFDPMLRLNPITLRSFFFYGGYGALCLLPVALDAVTELRFRRAKQRAFRQRMHA